LRRAINWFGLAAGIATILLIVVSLFIPWWIVQIGDGLFKVNTSPLNTNFSLAGDQPFAIPLIWALNLASILTLASGGIIILIYSLVPAKPYGKKLLDFSYKKPIYSVAFFVISLLTIIILCRSAFGINLPLVGEETVQLPQSMTFGTTIAALVSATFIWPFWLGIATAALCVTARLFHTKIVPTQACNNVSQQLPPPPPP